jgi:hypothetical protein
VRPAHAFAVEKSGDDMIREFAPRPSGVRDYLIGRKISVSWRPGDTYLCGTCTGMKRYQNATHKGCAHIARIARYRAEHPQ